MSERILKKKGLVIRHSMVELMEHWLVALSGLVLLLTGLFQLPISKRYYITSVPGLTWSGDFFTSLYLHYAASVIFIAAALFHIFYHGFQGEKGLWPQKGDMKASAVVIKSFFGKGEEPPFHKYLPEQRLAYVVMALIIALLIFSGLIKVYKNVYAPDMNYTLVLWATWIHNVSFILFILAFIGHIGAILLKPNRPMARGIFSGKVRLDYAAHRHPLWLEDMEGRRLQAKPAASSKEEEPVPVEELPEKEATDNAVADDATADKVQSCQEVTPPEEKQGNTVSAADADEEKKGV